MGEPGGRRATAVPLPDGASVLVRPIAADDKALIRAAYDRLGDESRYRRFLSPSPKLTESELRYLTEVDHRDHEALVAIDPASQEAVGVARYIRASDPETAEVAVSVVDDWQGRGVGTSLLRCLAGRAREEGISRFKGMMLATNVEMLDLARRLGPARVVGRDGPTVELEADLAEAAPGSGLEPALRLCADERIPARGAGTLVPGTTPASTASVE